MNRILKFSAFVFLIACAGLRAEENKDVKWLKAATLPEYLEAAKKPGKIPIRMISKQSFPGGIVDTEWKRAYVVVAGGIIDAIDLTTGKKLWSSAGKCFPIASDDQRVYAIELISSKSKAGRALRIVGLSIKQEGKLVSETVPIELPDEMENLGTNSIEFMAAGEIDEGDLLVTSAISGDRKTQQFDRMERAVVVDGLLSKAANKGAVTADLALGLKEFKLEPKRAEAARRLASDKIYLNRSKGVFVYHIRRDTAGTGRTLVCRNAKEKNDIWEYTLAPALKPLGGWEPSMLHDHLAQEPTRELQYQFEQLAP